MHFSFQMTQSYIFFFHLCVEENLHMETPLQAVRQCMDHAELSLTLGSNGAAQQRQHGKTTNTAAEEYADGSWSVKDLQVPQAVLDLESGLLTEKTFRSDASSKDAFKERKRTGLNLNQAERVNAIRWLGCFEVFDPTQASRSHERSCTKKASSYYIEDAQTTGTNAILYTENQSYFCEIIRYPKLNCSDENIDCSKLGQMIEAFHQFGANQRLLLLLFKMLNSQKCFETKYGCMSI